MQEAIRFSPVEASRIFMLSYLFSHIHKLQIGNSHYRDIWMQKYNNINASSVSLENTCYFKAALSILRNLKKWLFNRWFYRAIKKH